MQNFITDDDEQYLLDNITKMTWNNSLSRRTQHYGVEYNYKSSSIDKSKIDPLPEFMNGILEKMQHYFKNTINQCIINEYEPGQGISPHTDSKLFGPVVASLSLSSGCTMKFSSPNNDVSSLYLEPKSLLVLESDARYHWKHGINSVKSDIVDGKKIKRGTRISMTFRTIV